jgi:hypothetical protein
MNQTLTRASQRGQDGLRIESGGDGSSLAFIAPTTVF